MPYSSHKGVRTYYEVSGEGPPMVLLHATPWDHTLWLYQIAHFSTWFRVIAPDSRCFGRSDKVRDPFDFDDIVDETIALCETEGAQGAVLIGASLGSRLGLALGHKRPDLFKAVVVVGTGAESTLGGDTPGDRRRAQRVRRYRDEPIETAFEWQFLGTLSDNWPKTAIGAYVVRMIKERLPRFDGLAISNVFEASTRKNMIGLLPKMQVPFLVISGEFDRSLEMHKREAALMPDARHRILPGTGHACCIEDPAGFDAFVIEFLKELKMMPAPARREEGRCPTR